MHSTGSPPAVIHLRATTYLYLAKHVSRRLRAEEAIIAESSRFSPENEIPY